MLQNVAFHESFTSRTLERAFCTVLTQQGPQSSGIAVLRSSKPLPTILLLATRSCIAVTTTLDSTALAPGGPALVRNGISHITLEDILNLEYPTSDNQQNETPAQLLKELKESGGKEGGIAEGLRNVLDAPVDLPGG